MCQLFGSVICSATVTEVSVLNETNILERLEVSIDGGEIDPRITLTDSICYFFRGCMTELANCLEDEFALRSKA